MHVCNIVYLTVCKLCCIQNGPQSIPFEFLSTKTAKCVVNCLQILARYPLSFMSLGGSWFKKITIN